MKKILLLLLVIPIIGCKNPKYGREDPIWERSGGILNPWGGEFFDISIKRYIKNTKSANKHKW